VVGKGSRGSNRGWGRGPGEAIVVGEGSRGSNRGWGGVPAFAGMTEKRLVVRVERCSQGISGRGH
jgi:hypothetical protein